MTNMATFDSMLINFNNILIYLCNISWYLLISRYRIRKIAIVWLVKIILFTLFGNDQIYVEALIPIRAEFTGYYIVRAMTTI